MFHFPRASALALPLLIPAACSEGGSEDRFTSEVTITREHIFVRVTGALDFGGYPVLPAQISPLFGRFALRDDSTYVLSTSTARIEDPYSLEADGSLSIQLGQTNAPTLVYTGAYGLANDTGRFFLTDRVSGQVGLYLGVPTASGTPMISSFAGSWHAFALRALFSDPNLAADPDLIARGFAGKVAVAVDGTFAGSGSESRNPAALLSANGQLRAFADGEFEIDFSIGSDALHFDGGGHPGLIVGVQLDETLDQSSGLCALIAERTTPIDPSTLAGTYALGGWTLDTEVLVAGSDAELGTLEINASSQFRIQTRDNQGNEVEYTGDLTATNDGALTFALARPDEDWLGAVDESDTTIVIVDNARQAASGNDSLLRFLVAIRRNTP